MAPGPRIPIKDTNFIDTSSHSKSTYQKSENRQTNFPNSNPSFANYNMSSMGMGYGMNYFNPYMQTNGILSWIYTINYGIQSIGQMYHLFHMNANSLQQSYFQFLENWKSFIKLLKNSSFRKWLQKKSQKSKLIRSLFIIFAIGLTIQAMKLAKLLIQLRNQQRIR